MAEAAPKRVVVVGAGFGGLSTVTQLNELGTGELAEIHLIDSGSFFSIGGTWSFVLRDLLPLEATKLPLEAFQAGAAHVRTNTTVEALDLEGKSLALSGGETLGFDYLVLATGVESRPDLLPGLAEHGIDYSSIDQVGAYKEGVARVIAEAAAGPKAVVVLISECPYKCPPSPFENAFLLDDILRRAGVRDNVSVTVACPVPWPFGGPKLEAAFKEKMASKGIVFLSELQVTQCDPGVLTSADGQTLPFDLLLCTMPQRAPQVLTDAGLTNGKGLVPVDLQTNRTATEDVFCIGDACMAMLPPPVNKPHPKAGEFASQMGIAVANTIHAALRGEELPLPTTRNGLCMAESGGTAGIGVKVSFDDCITGTGGPKYEAVVNETGGSVHKLGWVNGYVTRFFGDRVPPFDVALPEAAPAPATAAAEAPSA